MCHGYSDMDAVFIGNKLTPAKDVNGVWMASLIGRISTASERIGES